MSKHLTETPKFSLTNSQVIFIATIIKALDNDKHPAQMQFMFGRRTGKTMALQIIEGILKNTEQFKTWVSVYDNLKGGVE
jgi:hypothetical protein